MEYLIYKSYLAAIENSVGAKLFRNFFVRNEKTGEIEDILQDGQKSCAVHTSSILCLYGLISPPPNAPHATVAGLIRDLEKNGWQKTEKPFPGAVLIWEKKKSNGEENLHAGFYLGKENGEDIAVSNNSALKIPVKHHWTFGLDKNGNPNRKIIAIYQHPCPV
jgi:hypothetical protein